MTVLGGALLGAALFCLLYGLAPLNVTNDAWLRGGYVERDTVQHYAGWLFFRQSAWSFPLAVAKNFNYPGGGYVGLSDSIPLFAVLFKLLEPVLPPTFQYFGLWGLLCSTLQGASAALLVGLFTQGRLKTWLLTALFVLSPIFLDRQLRHGALGAQWLILLALWLYFKHRRRAGAGQITFFVPGFVALCALSIVVHPYFTPMIFALLFALLAENAVAARRWWQPLCMLMLCLAATLALGWVLGVFHGGTGGGGTAFGFFSMNLNAPLNPAALRAGWSLLLPRQNQMPGNYDGFNYLGLGVLATLFVICVDTCLVFVAKAHKTPAFSLRRGRFGNFPFCLRPHAGLLFVCLCLTIFAISNVVSFGGRVLFTVPLPQALLNLAGTLRSSGRMFYPVWYLLLLGCGVYWLRRPPPRLRTAAVVGFAAVQLLDTSPGLYTKALSFRPYAAVAESAPQSPLWGALAGQYAHLATLDGAALTSTIDLAEYAADHRMTTTDPFTARYDVAEHDRQVSAARQALAAGTPAADTLYITSVEKTFLALAEKLDGQMFCAAVDGAWFVFAPYTGGFTGWPAADATVVRYRDYPLKIASYNDDLWDEGVLRPDKRVVCFYDTGFARERIDGMAAFMAGGARYGILEVSYKDEGWIMVTLDTPDASPLKDAPLVGVPAAEDAP